MGIGEGASAALFVFCVLVSIPALIALGAAKLGAEHCQDTVIEKFPQGASGDTTGMTTAVQKECDSNSGWFSITQWIGKHPGLYTTWVMISSFIAIIAGIIVGVITL